MARTRIKFCGITRAEDAAAAASLGADAVGFVFYGASPRAVEPRAAAEIAGSLPPFVTTVGLFVNAPADEIRRVCELTGIDVVQFHGDETPEACAASPRPWIKAVRVRDSADVVEAGERFAGARALLLDSFDPAVYGGSGRRFDWSLIPRERPLPIVLAGGLDADNVAEAIAAVEPDGVDVSGGIERAKGIKDYEKMQAFITQARRHER